MEINKIYCEDNLQTMSKMSNCFIDLVITSPPYDNLRKYNGYSFAFEDVAKELYRVVKEGGVVVWKKICHSLLGALQARIRDRSC